MRYKESDNGGITEEAAELAEDYELELEKEEEDLDFLVSETGIGESDKRKLAAGSRFSLKARRAIEDHLEEKKLRKELDYLLDDPLRGEENSDY